MIRKSILTYLVCILWIGCASHVVGQESISTIKLKNGSILKGEILEWKKDTISLKINDQVLFIAQDDLMNGFSKGNNSEEINRFYNRTSVSYYNGSIGNGYGLQHVFGYGFNQHFSVGIGVGINNYLAETGYNLFPLFLDVNYRIRSGETSPYIGLTSGYSFAFEDQTSNQISADGGLLLAPRIGYQIMINDLEFDIFSGLRFQKSTYNYRIPQGEATDKLYYKRLELGMGLSF